MVQPLEKSNQTPAWLDAACGTDGMIAAAGKM